MCPFYTSMSFFEARVVINAQTSHTQTQKIYCAWQLMNCTLAGIQEPRVLQASISYDILPPGREGRTGGEKEKHKFSLQIFQK